MIEDIKNNKVDVGTDEYGKVVGVSNRNLAGTRKIPPSNLINCFIVNMLTGTRINFVTLPTDVSEDYGASFGQQQPIGRSSPYFNYENNDARSVSYQVTLHKDIVPDMENVIVECKRLLYPKYSGSLVTPPYCYVRFGAMINMTAVLNSLGVEWGGASGVIVSRNTESAGLDPAEGDSQTYADAQLSFSFTEIRLKSLLQCDNVFDEGMVK